MTDPILTPEIYGSDHANPDGLAAAKAGMANNAVRTCSPSHARSYLAFARDDLLLSVLGSRDTAEAHRASAVDHMRIAAEYLGYTLTPR